MAKELAPIVITPGLEKTVVGDVVAFTVNEEGKTAYIDAAAARGITVETLKQVESLGKEYLDAAVTFAQEHAAKALKENKDAAKATYHLPFGTRSSDGVDFTITREKHFTFPTEMSKSTIQTVVSRYDMKPTTALVKGFEKQLTADLLGK